MGGVQTEKGTSTKLLQLLIFCFDPSYDPTTSIKFWEEPFDWM